MCWLIQNFKDIIKEKTKKNFPQNINEQLWGAISAVFLSWDSKRAKTYRKINYIPDHWGTAVNVQAMVFGNMGNNCATGVAFTRDPSTGKKEVFGELEIKVLKCVLSSKEDPPDTIAYLQIKDLSAKNKDQVFIFNGWTFASTPTLKSVDHPVYDVWLVGCENV